MASWSSVTGRPWHARRTPRTILSRLNGSVAPLRLATIRITVSWVVNRRPHSWHDRRRRIAAPSSAVRLSITRLSEYRQYGQYMRSPPAGRCALSLVDHKLWKNYSRVSTRYCGPTLCDAQVVLARDSAVRASQRPRRRQLSQLASPLGAW